MNGGSIPQSQCESRVGTFRPRLIRGIVIIEGEVVTKPFSLIHVRPVIFLGFEKMGGKRAKRDFDFHVKMAVVSGICQSGH